MNTTQIVAITSAIVVAGRWQQDEPITVNLAVGGGVLAIGLAVLSNINADFGKIMGYTVLVAAIYAYGPSLVKGLGFSGALADANRRRI